MWAPIGSADGFLPGVPSAKVAQSVRGGKSRGKSHLVMARLIRGLVPAIPIIEHCAMPIEIGRDKPRR